MSEIINEAQIESMMTGDAFKNLVDLTTKVQNEASSTGVNFQKAGVPNPVILDSAVKKINAIRDELNVLFKERQDIIDMSLIGLITEQPVLLLGAHGTAKSALINEICSRITNARFFSWLLNPTSDPTELFGPFSIKEMENDRFMRITAGKLPEAEIAFLDEVYKSNAPTLNALLTIMNEKIFFNDGKKVDVPLITMFGASNESPEPGDPLMPLHDRFIFRVEVEYLKDNKNVMSMFENFIIKRNGKMAMNHTTISIDEIKALQMSARSMPIPKSVLKEYANMIAKFKQANSVSLVISDRRKNECLKILQGTAAFSGRSCVGYEDFRLLPYAFWETREQLPILMTEIAKRKNPNEEEFVRFKTSFEDIKKSIDQENDKDSKTSLILSNKTSVQRIITGLNKITTDSSTGDPDFLQQVKDYKQSVIKYSTDVMEKFIADTAFA